MVDTAIKEEKEPMMNKILTNSSAPRSEAWWSKLILVASLLVQMQKSWMALILKLVKENKNINEEKPKLCALRGPGYHQWSIAGSLFKELALWNPRPANVDLMMGLRVNKKEQEVPKVRCLHGGIMLHCNIFLEEKTVGPFLKIAGWCDVLELQHQGLQAQCLVDGQQVLLFSFAASTNRPAELAHVGTTHKDKAVCTSQRSQPSF